MALPTIYIHIQGNKYIREKIRASLKSPSAEIVTSFLTTGDRHPRVAASVDQPTACPRPCHPPLWCLIPSDVRRRSCALAHLRAGDPTAIFLLPSSFPSFVDGEWITASASASHYHLEESVLVQVQQKRQHFPSSAASFLARGPTCAPPRHFGVVLWRSSRHALPLLLLLLPTGDHRTVVRDSPSLPDRQISVWGELQHLLLTPLLLLLPTGDRLVAVRDSPTSRDPKPPRGPVRCSPVRED